MQVKKIISLMMLMLLISCSSLQTHDKHKPDFELSAMVGNWNQMIIETAIKEDGLLTLKGVRTATMAHLAMHDALNSAMPQFETYTYKERRLDAAPIIAMAEAAFTIANEFYPDNRDMWLSEKTKWMNYADSKDALEQGVLLGRATAEAIIKMRLNDGWDGETEYQWHPMAPGVYAEFNEHSGTPEGFIFGAGWANAQPFSLTSNKQFLAPPPPEINSDAYTQAFNEVKELGRYISTTRTDDQTHLALWWKEFSENSHNQLARQLVQEQQLGLAATTRLFALLNMAIFDAYINVFYNKFYYNHWRPYSAIRWAKHDGNPNTVEDLSWTNTHQHTYAFPSYPSAHGTACTAAMQVMIDVFGAKFPFVMTTNEVDKAGPFSEKITMEPAQRSFNNFAEAALECSMSRVYLGIHFRYDSIEGNKLGARIGNQLLTNQLLPIKSSPEN